MSRIASSSMARSSSAVILSLAKSSRACSSSGGRRRLPTWSARYGGVVRTDMPGTLPRPQFLQRRARTQEHRPTPTTSSAAASAMPPTAARPANGMSIESVASTPDRPRTSDRPTRSARRIAGTSGANTCHRIERASVARGTPVATSAAYVRRRATIPSASATSRPAAAIATPTMTAASTRFIEPEVEVAIRFAVAAVDQRLQPRAELGRAGPEDHAREQRRERPAPSPRDRPSSAARPAARRARARYRCRTRPATYASHPAPATTPMMPIAPPTNGSNQPGTSSVGAGVRSTREGEQRREDQQRRPRARGAGADPPDHAERRHRDAPQQQAPPPRWRAVEAPRRAAASPTGAAGRPSAARARRARCGQPGRRRARRPRRR